jgi:hypothetical protein
LYGLLAVLVLENGFVYGQETNTDVIGIVKTQEGDLLEGASVTVLHQPTQSLYKTSTNSKGYFHFFNLKPGGPYIVTISFVGFKTEYISELYTQLSSGSFYSQFPQKERGVFILQRHVTEMPTLAIKRNVFRENTIGTETNITQDVMRQMPTISRNIQDYARLVPQAKVYSDGGMSFAGQNNKFNAFYIDGANTMDLLGVSSSGISGGQTSSPPVSVDALEEIRILISPYDVQYGNFTGASINAITRSGSDEFKGSAWYYFRNEDMAGGSPVKDPATGQREKLSPFFNNTFGTWISGPLVKGKLFYFASAEFQKEEQPQPFEASEYKGNTTKQQLDALNDTLFSRYGYDAGGYDLTFNNLRAFRYMMKLDWNASPRHKISFTYRLNSAERQTPALPNGSTMIRYQNNGYKINSNSNFATLEWRSFLNSKLSNRVLISYSQQQDDRQILGLPFPSVSIQDGIGTIVFGTNGSGQVSLFKGKDLTIVDVFKLTHGSHVFSLGTDFGFSWLNDLFMGSHYGSYFYRSLNDFLSNNFPFRYQRTLLSTEEPVDESSSNAGASFMTSRLGFFLQDEWKINPELRLRYGVRVDGNGWNTSYPADEYFNTEGIPAISQYYDLGGARSGQVPRTHWQFQPRVELTSRIPDEDVTFKIGAGVFTGHILNIWPSDVYNYKIASLDVTPSRYNLRFEPDVNSQPGFKSLGLDPDNSKGNLIVVAPDLKYPTIVRLSSLISKTIGKGWNLGLEFLLTRNLHEVKYTNVNILPPVLKSSGAGSRVVYSPGLQPPLVPMTGGNPYSSILLMANNNDRKGYFYGTTATLSSPVTQRSSLVVSYSYGHSKALFEPTGQSGPNSQQWRSLETVNGRNQGMISVSDFDLLHRIYVYGMRKFTYAKGRISTSVSLFYQGQSGQPYSYVYSGSIVNDVGQNERFDLIYVPTSKELQEMVFLPLSGSSGNYSPDQQKAMLESFIEADPYLRGIRGSFSERNKARLPFTHTADIRIQQDFCVKAGKKNIRFGLIFDVFNFLNMLNPEWGRIYQVPGDNVALIQFAKFVSATDLTPQYQFSLKGKPWSVHTSTAPGSSARWISQLGFRFYL